MDKIKLELNPDEVSSLFHLIQAVNFNEIQGKENAFMCRFILESIFFKLARKLAKMDRKDTKLNLKLGEAAALRVALETLDLTSFSTFEYNLCMRMFSELDQGLMTPLHR